MADDGSGSDITISMMLMFKQDSDGIKAELGKGTRGGTFDIHETETRHSNCPSPNTSNANPKKEERRHSNKFHSDSSFSTDGRKRPTLQNDVIQYTRHAIHILETLSAKRKSLSNGVEAF